MNNKNLFFVPLLLLLWISVNPVFSQNCPCTVDAGKDKNLCDPGGSVQLDGSITGSPLVIEWTPSAGLSDPNVINPTATVDQTTTYTLSIKCLNPTNLVVNANFNNGNTGFSSDYTYSATNLQPEGIYTVTNNPQLVHPGFSPCQDHTGAGQMMVVNGAGTPGLNVWCQTIPVMPNTDYAFESWVASVVAGAPALLQFSINGQTIGPIFQAPGNTCFWEQFTSVWNSGSSTSATICILNQNTELGGNDFALDDISFKALCTITDKVTVFVNPVKYTNVDASICEGQTYQIAGQTYQNEGSYDIPLKTWKGCDSIVTLNLTVIEVNAEVDPPDKLDCGLTEVQIFGDNSSFGPDYTYLWTTTNGHILSDPTLSSIIADKPGKYTLTVIFNNGIIKCTKDASVLLETDYTKPVIDAGKDDKLTCADTVLTLKGTVISPDKYSVNWSTPNGKFLSKTDTLNPQIGSPGIYIFTATSLYNGCSTVDTVIIGKDPNVPFTSIVGDDVINCKVNNLWLDGTKSDNGPNYQYVWSTSGGNFISKTDSLQVNVNSPGIYLLTITNLLTGCKSNATFIVDEDKINPVIDAGPKETLSCAIKDLNLAGIVNIPDSAFTILWTSANGKIISGKDSLNPVIAAPGTYIFQVTNNLNGCISIDSVVIEKDNNTPNVANLLDKTLTCAISQVSLDGTGSSSGPDFSYQWSTSNGQILGPLDSIIVQSDKPGIYVLSIINQLNGCISSDTLEIKENKVLPKASAGIDDKITCDNPTISLDGTQSSIGINYTYTWSVLGNGNIISGINTTTPVVNQAGKYQIEVFDKTNGCLNIDSVFISIDTISPKILMPNDVTITCAIPEIYLAAMNQGAAGNYIYVWSTANGNIISGDNTLISLVDKPGDYTFTTTNQDNGCSVQQSVKVLSNEKLPIIDAGKDTLINCFYSSINLLANLTYAAGNISIKWTSSSNPPIVDTNTLSPEIAFPGLYTITVKDTVTGCKASDNILISIDTITPKTTIEIPAILTCKILISTIQLDMNNPQWSYTWNTVDGKIVGALDDFNVMAAEPGTYSVIISDNNNGCTITKTVQVNQDIKPPIISAGPDKELTCTVKSVQLEGSISSNIQNSTVEWNYNNGAFQGSTNLQPNVQLSGLYSLIVTDEGNGCSSTDTVLVLQNTNVPNDIVADLTPPGCKLSGKIIVKNTVGGMGPYTYSLNGGPFQNQLQFQSLSAGKYQLKVKDVNGCEFDKSFELLDPPPLMVELPALITIEYGQGGQLLPVLNIPDNQIEKILWNPTAGLSCADCLRPFAMPDYETWYNLNITDSSGCFTSAKVHVLVIKDFHLYVPNAFSPNGDGNNDKWMIFGDIDKVINIKHLEIYDRWGEKMFEASDFAVNDPDFGWNGKFHDKTLNPEVFVYYFEAEFADGSNKLYKGDINLIR